MKRIFCLMALLAILFNVCVQARVVENVGTWGNDRIRSYVPACPVVEINDNVLSIYLADALENLNIVVTDNNGNIVYQDCISSNGNGYTHTIYLDEQPQGYTIEITHFYGHLTGSFNVD